MRTKRKVVSNDAKLLTPTTFQREEWSFRESSISDDELYACLIYEYARESRTMVKLSATRDRGKIESDRNQNEAIERYNVENAKMVRLLAVGQIASYEEVKPREMTYSKWDNFYTEFHIRAAKAPLYDWIYEFALDWARPYFEPWQLLAPSLRKKISSRGKNDDSNRMVCPALLKDLEELWFANSAVLEKLRKEPKVFCSVPENDDLSLWQMSEKEWFDNEFRMCENAFLYGKIERISRSLDSPYAPDELAELCRGRTIAAFAIDLARFSNKQLANAFCNWLNKINPAGQNKPPQRGKKRLNTPRAALECLGVMRLLHRYPAKSWSVNCPEAWKIYWPKAAELHKDRAQDPAKILYKKRERALAYYHMLFPFLKDEKPISWPTAGGHSS